MPKKGGDTLFANQQAAYDDLSDAMKRRIEPLYAIHHYGNRHDTDEASRTAASPLTDEQKAKMPLITHKIARPHPVTGRKSLYAVNGSSFGIVGMPEDEALDLLDELAAHSTQPKYRYSLKYGVGDVVVWDNASLLHSATLTDPDDPRTLWRITVLEPAATGSGAAGDRSDLRDRRDVDCGRPRPTPPASTSARATARALVSPTCCCVRTAGSTRRPTSRAMSAQHQLFRQEPARDRRLRLEMGAVRQCDGY